MHQGKSSDLEIPAVKMGRGIFAGKAAFTTATPKLFMFCIIYSLGSIFFG